MAIFDEDGNEFNTFDELVASWPKPTFWESVWYKIRRLKEIPWWFKHRFVPKHRYHIAKTKPFLKPGYHDPLTRIQVVLFEETYQFVENQKRQGCWELVDVDEDGLRKMCDTDECVKDYQKIQKENRKTREELEEVANWWALRRETGDFYLESDYEGTVDQYCKKMGKVDKEIDKMIKKVIKNLHSLWY